MRKFFSGLAVALAMLPATAWAEDTGATRTELQAAMQRQIDRTLVEGAVVYLDFEAGTTMRLYPTEAHPLVLQGEGFFVLCADLVTEDGTNHPVDYYVVETDRGYRIIRTEINNRSPLREMMRAGHVREF